LQILAWFEADRFTGWDCHFLPGPGVAADAPLSGFHDEDSKAAKFDAFAAREGFLHRVEEGIHSLLRFHLRNAGFFRHPVNDV
jgi:hypothetical protein